MEPSRLPPRHCSVPASCLPSRDDRSSPNQSPTSTAHRAVQQPRAQPQGSAARQSGGNSPVMHQRAPGQGPPLGTMGWQPGMCESFAYSEANKNSGIIWSDKHMLEYYIPGTKMVFAGVKEDTERADLVAFMQPQG